MATAGGVVLSMLWVFMKNSKVADQWWDEFTMF